MSLVRSFTKVASIFRPNIVRAFSGGNDPLKDRESVYEKEYVNKEDGRIFEINFSKGNQKAFIENGERRSRRN